MSPLDRKNDLRSINADFQRQITAAKDNSSQPKKVVIDFRNDVTVGLARPIYQIPIELLRFRKNNGRIASDVLTWESKHGEIEESTNEGQDQLRRFLNKKHTGEGKTLYDSLKHAGQREHAIITCDGFLINGNRRKMTMEKLAYDNPNDSRFKFLKAAILPGPGEPGGEPTILEIEQVENRLQLMKTGKAEYKGFDQALSYRRKQEIGMSIEEQLRDNPEHYSKTTVQINREIKKVKKNFLFPLECIERYLEHFDRQNKYDLVSDRWQAFVDYSNFYNGVLKEDSDRIKYFDGKVGEEDIPTIEDIAFKMIRKGSFNKDAIPDKLHMLMRQLKEIYKDDDAREVINKIADDKEIPHDLTREEIEELEDPDSIRERDRAWKISTDSKFTMLITKAKEIRYQSKILESPLDSIIAIQKKLDKITFSNKMKPKEVREFFREFRSAQDKLDDLVDELDGLRQSVKKERME